MTATGRMKGLMRRRGTRKPKGVGGGMRASYYFLSYAEIIYLNIKRDNGKVDGVCGWKKGSRLREVIGE